jgi:hypothetical protein
MWFRERPDRTKSLKTRKTSAASVADFCLRNRCGKTKHITSFAILRRQNIMKPAVSLSLVLAVAIAAVSAAPLAPNHYWFNQVHKRHQNVVGSRN